MITNNKERQYFDDPESINGIKVVQDYEEIEKQLKAGNSVYHWELGDSMVPILHDGEYCLIMNLTDIDDVKQGDAVFCKMKYGYMVHMVGMISDCGFNQSNRKWFQIVTTNGDNLGWTQDIIGKAYPTNFFNEKALNRQFEIEQNLDELSEYFHNNRTFKI